MKPITLLRATTISLIVSRVFVWLWAPVVALGFVVWIQRGEIRHIETLSEQPTWSVDAPVQEPDSLSGYSGGERLLMLDDQAGTNFQWPLRGESFRFAKVETRSWVKYDNAPFGRTARYSTCYPACLAAFAKLWSAITGQSYGKCVERASLYFDPVLQAVLVSLCGLFVAVEFGATPFVLFVLLSVFLFPLGGVFSAGSPSPFGMTQGLVLACSLFLFSGLQRFAADACLPSCRGDRLVDLHLSVSGLLGGVGLWLSPATFIPFLTSISTGAVIFQVGNDFVSAPRLLTLPWRLWSLCGCAAELLGLWCDGGSWTSSGSFDYAPTAYAVAWVAAGFLLHGISKQKEGWRNGAISSGRRISLASRVIAVVILCVVLVWTSKSLLVTDLEASRILSRGEHVYGSDTASYFAAEGISLRLVALALPLAVAMIRWLSHLLRRGDRCVEPISHVGGSMLVAMLVLAAGHVRYWNTFEAVAVPLTVGTLQYEPPESFKGRLRSIVAWAACCVLGLSAILSLGNGNSEGVLSPREFQNLVSRDLALWLHRKNPHAIILAPPVFTSALIFNGNLRGLATLDLENREGLTAAVRISEAATFEEAERLLRRRGVTHLVLPSWETTFSRQEARQSKLSSRKFFERIENWDLPPWLRPIPYYVPSVPGLEATEIIVLQVVAPRSEAIAASELANYFLETGRRKEAFALAPELKRFANDISSVVALYELAIVAGDGATAKGHFETISDAVENGAADDILDSSGYSIAIALARGGRDDLARPILAELLRHASMDTVRSLSARKLLRVLALSRYYGLRIENSDARRISLELVPPASRSSLD